MSWLNKVNCPFCRMGWHQLDYVPVIEDGEVMVIMDLYPATPGHVLVLPKNHIETLYELPADLGARIMNTAIAVARAIKEKLSPDGINLIQANEAAAGQTIPHIHFHLVPRNRDDQIILRFSPEKAGEN